MALLSADLHQDQMSYLSMLEHTIFVELPYKSDSLPNVMGSSLARAPPCHKAS